MSRRMLRCVPALVLAFAGLLWVGVRVSGQSGTAFPSTKNGEWTHYTADVRGSKYSPLDQIKPPTSTSWRWRGASRPTT